MSIGCFFHTNNCILGLRCSMGDQGQSACRVMGAVCCSCIVAPVITHLPAGGWYHIAFVKSNSSLLTEPVHSRLWVRTGF
jgi:hypothetical protein